MHRSSKQDEAGAHPGLSLSINFEEELYPRRRHIANGGGFGAPSPGTDEAGSLGSVSNNLAKMRLHSERQTSIEKIVNDVLIPPLSDSSPNFGANSDGAGNGDVSPPSEVCDIDLSNISPLSSVQQQPQQQQQRTMSHPYFSALDKDVDPVVVVKEQEQELEQEQDDDAHKITPINISDSLTSTHKRQRVHYSNTPNILTSQYYNEFTHHKASTSGMVKDDLYYLQYGHRNSSHFHFHSHEQQQQQQQQQHQHQHHYNQHQQQRTHYHAQQQQQQQQQQRRSLRQQVAVQQQHHHHQQQHQHHVHQHQHHRHSVTSPLTPHSVHTARTTINSPQSVRSVHSSHTPHTPHSMNHAFPRFTPYSTHTNVSTTSSSLYKCDDTTAPVAVQEQEKQEQEKCVNNKVEETVVVVVEEEEVEVVEEKEEEVEEETKAEKQQQQQKQQPPQTTTNVMIRDRRVESRSFLKSAPRLNYEEEGLSAAEVEEVLSQLEIRPDTLRDSSTDFRPVFSCIRPIVCHKSNTPFYAQCSTAKLGYCTWCRQLRRGNQKQGSICLNCGERLTAKYHRWYPHLVRLEPVEKTRTKSLYMRYKPVFERFGITWHNDKQFEFVIDHYMLMKIYLSTENFNIEPLHLERTYMIGVFAGREFNTGALARKLLREGTKLAMFRADFPDYYDFLRDERAAVAEQMNLRFFQGIYKCYFHAHYTNIEGWYDPSVISRESIIETFKELCNTILAHTALAHINGSSSSNNNNKHRQQQQQQQGHHNHHHHNHHRHHQRKQHQQQQQQQQQQAQEEERGARAAPPPAEKNKQHKSNSQLLAATQSMLNGISAMTPINQLSVTNMAAAAAAAAAITPIGKVKTFQFNNASVNAALSPAYLPPLATTPRFTVSTPRNAAAAAAAAMQQQYHAINLNGMAALGMAANASSPIHIGRTASSNPPSVSMLSAAAAGMQIGSSIVKKKDAKAGAAEAVESNKKERQSSAKKIKMMLLKHNKNNSLNATAAPFLLNTQPTAVMSPPISPRNFNGHTTRLVAPPPPPPQSFAFPAPPLPPHTNNWLPVPPVLHHHHVQQQQQQQQLPPTPRAIHMIPNAALGNITPISMQMLSGKEFYQPPAALMSHQAQHHHQVMAQQQLQHHQQQQHQHQLQQLQQQHQRQYLNQHQQHQQHHQHHHHHHQQQHQQLSHASPLFTPTQSPKFQPFSH